MKKSISFVLIFTLLLSACFAGVITASETAADTEKTTITIQIGSNVMNVNGKETPVDEEGAVPVVVNGSTVLPVKGFVEAVGGEYNQSGETVEITYGGTEITINSVSGKAAVNGEETSLDTEPQTIEGSLYLPLRFTTENMGYSVIWTADSRTITVIDADTIENVFAKGDLNPAADYFTGVSYVNWLSSYDETMKIPAFGQVTFEPCTRTDWHTHDGGQILLVTEGVGVFEMEGETARLM
ncbi:MAG: hypothetical protein LUD77_07435 [Clostridiales bacterium]|nr:hypothetical protein [Clostridiales bacterium]